MYKLEQLLQTAPCWSPVAAEEYALLVPLPTLDGEKYFLLKVTDVASLTSLEIWNIFFVFADYREQAGRQLVMNQNVSYSEFEKFYRTPDGKRYASAMRVKSPKAMVALAYQKHAAPLSRLFVTSEANIRARGKAWVRNANSTSL